MEEIKSIVHDLIGKMSRTDEGHLIEQSFFEITDYREKDHIRLIGIKDGVVYFQVDTSSWLYHFRMKRNFFLKKIKAKLKDTGLTVKEIRFKIGNMNG